MCWCWFAPGTLHTKCTWCILRYECVRGFSLQLLHSGIICIRTFTHRIHYTRDAPTTHGLAQRNIENNTHRQHNTCHALLAFWRLVNLSTNYSLVLAELCDVHENVFAVCAPSTPRNSTQTIRIYTNRDSLIIKIARLNRSGIPVQSPCCCAAFANCNRTCVHVVSIFIKIDCRTLWHKNTHAGNNAAIRKHHIHIHSFPHPSTRLLDAATASSDVATRSHETMYAAARKYGDYFSRALRSKSVRQTRTRHNAARARACTLINWNRIPCVRKASAVAALPSPPPHRALSCCLRNRMRLAYM